MPGVSATGDFPKRVLLVSNRVMHYRVSVYNYFHRRFQDHGCEFSVIADSLQRENQQKLEFGFREMPFKFSDYKAAITETKPDAVILFMLLKDKMVWPLAHWLRLKGIPFAFWTKGGNWDQKSSRLRYHLFNYIHGLADGTILYAKECREFLKPSLRETSFVANNTINFEDFPPIPESKDEIKREFDIPFRKVVIFIGRMGAGKGRKRVDSLIDMFARQDRSDIGLVLVGSGLSEELQARINSKNTRYLGEVHDPQNIKISKLCKMADVCAIPGHVGLGLNQAFFWGLPVVTAEGDHPPEVGYLKSGRNGFMVPEGDFAAMEQKILFLLENDAAREEFSRHAREDILREASIERMFTGFRDCVQQIGKRK